MSPVISLFSETLAGLDSIRAYGRAEAFVTKSFEAIDTNTSPHFYFHMAARFLALYMDMTVNMLTCGVFVFAVAMRDELPVTVLALAIIYVNRLTGTLQWTLRNFVEVENALTSVERMMHYGELKTEAPYRATKENGLIKPAE